MQVRTAVAGGLLLLFGVAACSGSSGSGGSAAGSAASGEAFSARGAVDAPAASASAAAAPAAGGSSAGAASVRISSAAKIRAAELSVSVRKGSVPVQADRAGAIAQGVGGEIDSDDRTSGTSASASLRLLVPPSELTGVLTALGKLGHEDSRTLSTKDVTTQVADVASRVISARAAIVRLTALYAHGGKVADVIAIENELARRQADLESLEAQQKALAAQTSFATITLNLRTAKPAVVVHHKADHSGFLGGLSRGWDAFTHAARAVATGVGASLPFLAVVVLALLAARVLWSRFGRRPTPIPMPSDDPIA